MESNVHSKKAGWQCPPNSKVPRIGQFSRRQWKPAHCRLGVDIRTSKRDVCTALSGRNVLARMELGMTGGMSQWSGPIRMELGIGGGGLPHSRVDLSEWS